MLVVVVVVVVVVGCWISGGEARLRRAIIQKYYKRENLQVPSGIKNLSVLHSHICLT